MRSRRLHRRSVSHFLLRGFKDYLSLLYPHQPSRCLPRTPRASRCSMSSCRSSPSPRRPMPLRRLLPPLLPSSTVALRTLIPPPGNFFLPSPAFAWPQSLICYPALAMVFGEAFVGKSVKDSIPSYVQYILVKGCREYAVSKRQSDKHLLGRSWVESLSCICMQGPDGWRKIFSMAHN